MISSCLNKEMNSVHFSLAKRPALDEAHWMGVRDELNVVQLNSL